MLRVFALGFIMACATAAPLKPSDIPKGPASATKVIYSGTGVFQQGLTLLNPYLTAADLVNISKGAACDSRKPWEMCNDNPSLFNGLAIHSKDDKGITFLGVTDMGPNVECDEFPDEAEDDDEWKDFYEKYVIKQSTKKGLGYAVPKFSPTFFKATLDKDTGKLSIGDVCYLKNSKNEPINGIVPNMAPNLPNAWGASCTSGPIPYSGAGVDPEDIQKIPGTNLYAMVEEFSPSLIIAKGFSTGKSCGQIVARYVPVDAKINSAKAGYPVIKVLPKLFTLHRADRGMQSLAVAPNGKKLIAMLEAPAGDNEASPVNTAVEIDISTISKPKVLGAYIYLESFAGETGSAWVDEDEQGDVKISSFTDVSGVLGLGSKNTVVLAIERASDQVKVFMADFTGATNILPKLNGDPLRFNKLGDYQQTVDALKKMGIVTAKKATVLDSKLIDDGSEAISGWVSDDKQEGIAIINKCVIALGNDNDFSLDADPSTLMVIQLSKCLDTVYKRLKSS